MRYIPSLIGIIENYNSFAYTYRLWDLTFSFYFMLEVLDLWLTRNVKLKFNDTFGEEVQKIIQIVGVF